MSLQRWLKARYTANMSRTHLVDQTRFELAFNPGKNRVQSSFVTDLDAGERARVAL